MTINKNIITLGKLGSFIMEISLQASHQLVGTYVLRLLAEKISILKLNK